MTGFFGFNVSSNVIAFFLHSKQILVQMESMASQGCQNLYLLSHGDNPHFLLVLCLAVGSPEFWAHRAHGALGMDMQMKPEETVDTCVVHISSGRACSIVPPDISSKTQVPRQNHYDFHVSVRILNQVHGP